MKTSIISLLIGLFLVSNSAFAKGGGTVKGYTTKSGKYVAPHRRTLPNKTKSDNWSTKGNVNPDTGKPGSKSE